MNSVFSFGISLCLFGVLLTNSVKAAHFLQINQETGQETNKNITGSTVVLRVLDKVTAKVYDLRVPLDSEIPFGSLTVLARFCQKAPPEERPEVIAFFEVRTAYSSNIVVQNLPEEKNAHSFQPPQDKKLLFSGWMFASSPGINSFSHPILDIWVVDCI